MTEHKTETTDITERKRVEYALLEKTLKRSNSILKAQREASIDGIVTVDENKCVTDYNQRFIELWNIPDDIVKSQDDKKLLIYMLSCLKSPDEFLEKIRYLYENTLDIGQDEIETIDGRTFDWYCSPIISSENKYLGKIWYFRDISDRKQTEQALLEGEERYRNLVENISDVVYMLDPKGFFVYISPIVEFATGFSPEEVVGRHMSEFIYHEDLPIIYDQFHKLISGQKAPILEYRFYKKSGEICWGRTSNRPKLKDGVVESIQGLFTDITERKRAEEALRQSEERFRAFYDLGLVGLAITSPEKGWIHVNDCLCAMLGYTMDELSGMTWAEFTHPDDLAADDKQFLRLINGEIEGYELEKRFISRFGMIIFTKLVVRCIRNPDYSVDYIVAMVEDITDRKMAEEELLKAKEAAETANRFKSDFLSNMSHEIRTPMNAIMGFTELLSSMIQDEQQKSYLQAIRSGGKNLLTLINDILDLSKIEAGKFDIRYEPVNPHHVFNEIRQIFEIKMSEKNLEFITDISADIPESLMLDEVRLRQILFNLIGNAVKFTEKGYVKISVECEVRSEKYCDLMISVVDTGIGVLPEYQGRIFEAFIQQEGQSAKKYGGTGLGLAITKRLVEMMKGNIVLESEQEKGSIFRITFHDVAISRTVSEAAEPKLTDTGNFIFGPATILVADDVKMNLFLIKAFFRDTHIRIIEAEDGRQAVSAAGQYMPDIILMDISMPVMDGYEAVRQIRLNAALKHIPIIALTAKAMSEDKEQIVSAGFDGYLTKPVNRSALFSELSRFITYTEKSKK